MNASTPRIVYLANRTIGIECLKLLLKAGATPIALVLPTGAAAEGTDEMKKLIPDVPCIEGKEAFLQSEEFLRSLKPEYLLSVHFPLIIPKNIIELASIGTLNLHPAYLPFNRGWHTPSWAILEDTPYGATFHWIDDGVDTGPIAFQKQIEVLPTDTAHSLYQRALAAEVEVFKEALPDLIGRTLPKIPQQGVGTSHKRAELEAMRRLDPEMMTDEEMQKRIRALTTNKEEEAAYIETDGTRKMMRA